MSWPFLLGRIGVRFGVGVWRHRLGLIIAGVLVMAFGAYEYTFAGPTPASSGGDCADTAMAAVTHVTDASARAAYECLGAPMRTTSEEQFVASMQQRAPGGDPGQASRVADRHTPDGGKIVFYTVAAGDMPAVGYIVYLDPSGKVVKVE
jgi:hypothetical protein